MKLLRAQLRRYCDQRGHTLLPAADVTRVLHWSNYSAKAVAQIQARGMPIDMLLWNLVQENKRAVIGELLRQFDPSYGSENPIFNPMASGTTPASSAGSSIPASLTGRGWKAASSTSTATPFA